MTRRNPYSTGYVAAKIRANTARRNGGERTQMPLPQYFEAHGFSWVAIRGSSTSGYFYAGTESKMGEEDGGIIYIGFAHDNDKLVIAAWWAEQIGEFLGEQEYDTLQAALIDVKRGGWAGWEMLEWTD